MPYRIQAKPGKCKHFFKEVGYGPFEYRYFLWHCSFCNIEAGFFKAVSLNWKNGRPLFWFI